ncbi:MAG: hypothetical protein RR505_01820 [Raoultibacter sp.]
MMERLRGIRIITDWTLHVLVSACLLIALVPGMAFADTAVKVSTEKPTQVSEVVTLGNTIDTNGASAVDAGVATARGTEVAKNENLLSKADAESHRVTADVPLSAQPSVSQTLLFDGLTYQLDHVKQTATLVGWHGEAPKGELAIPSQVNDGSIIYTVAAVGLSDDEIENTQKPLGGVHIFSAQNFVL